MAFRNVSGDVDVNELVKLPGSWPTTSWYKEVTLPKVNIWSKVKCIVMQIKDHNYKTEKMVPKSGHFTQLVWKAIKHVGCARSLSKENKVIYAVCRYTPPGNSPNNKAGFEENVKPPVKNSNILELAISYYYRVYSMADYFQVDGSDPNGILDFDKLKIKT